MQHEELAQERFSLPLLAWYKAGNRDLPWRRSRNPYHIWVSEIMLQQTRVETVIPFFNRFMELFPTVDKLADAPEEQVLKAWEGLGYYSRARNLQAAAREVRDHFGGVVPDTPEGIASLKGVGPYTAGAILSIAYNLPEPAVDGNVMRVLSRYFLLEEDIAKPSTRIGIEKLARSLIPPGEAGGFNQALMELGATICTPKSPHCLPCPVMEHCAARLEGRAEELPLKAKAKPPRPERRAVALVEGAGVNAGRILVRQRPADGLLARMWELPHVQLPELALAEGGDAREGIAAAAASQGGRGRGVARRPRGSAAGGMAAASAEAHGRAMGFLAATLAAEDGAAVLPVEWLMDAEHLFSHIRWDLAVYRCRPAPGFGGVGAAAAANRAAESAAVYSAASVGGNDAPGGAGADGAAAAAGNAPELDGDTAASGIVADNAAAAGFGSAADPAADAGPDFAAGALVPAPHTLPSRGGLPPRYRWMSWDELDQLAFPNVFLRILKTYREAFENGGVSR
ncbi:A/G-specific adenine glycosylase [Paenibacillus sp. YN15]|uniref:A/G-specific adenine glycosylase n=1 Tax=Paenibacillus sp. YN15 TaxID=1742774 RepID=UPI0037C50907